MPRAARRLAAAACLAAPLALLLGQVLLTQVPDDVGTPTLERIAAAPAAWEAAHLLIGLSLVGYAVLAAALAQLVGPSPLAVGGVVLTALGVVVQAGITGVDAVLGALATLPDRPAATAAHRALAEQVVAPLDRWDLALVAGLVLLALALRGAAVVPVPASTVLLLGLAVPAPADLRVAAAGAVVVGFAAVAAALWRGVDGTSPGRLSTLVVAAAYLAAATVSWERAALGAVVVAVLAAQAVTRPSGPARARPARTAAATRAAR